LQTQSAIGRLFQKVGDAFRSLTASGRASIAERTANLKEAIAERLRGEFSNPTAAPKEKLPKDYSLRALCSQLHMYKAVQALPASVREAVRNSLPGYMDQITENRRANGRDAEYNVMEHPDEVQEILEKIVKNNPGYTKFEKLEQMTPLINQHQDAIKVAFKAQLTGTIKGDQATRENPAHIHQTHLLDADRCDKITINGLDAKPLLPKALVEKQGAGHAADFSSYEQAVTALIPEQTGEKTPGLARYIATTIAQHTGAGLGIISLLTGTHKDGTMGLPKDAGLGYTDPVTFTPTFATGGSQVVSMDKDGAGVRVRYTMDAPINLRDPDAFSTLPALAVPLKSYTVTVFIPFDQPGGIDDPRFDIESVTVGDPIGPQTAESQ
jgi:hypothetical protein